MRLVFPAAEILSVTDNATKLIELAGRTCYKSEDRITQDSSKNFVKKIIANGHHSVIEHATMTVRFICDRGVTHELVRHRLASFSQESTRYCNYSDRPIQFVIPPWTGLAPGIYDEIRNITALNFTQEEDAFALLLLESERVYLRLIRTGWTPQQARNILPNALKTEIVVTANLREWRHILALRMSKKAHPQMRQLMELLWVEILNPVGIVDPIFFDDLRFE